MPYWTIGALTLFLIWYFWRVERFRGSPEQREQWAGNVADAVMNAGKVPTYLDLNSSVPGLDAVEYTDIKNGVRHYGLNRDLIIQTIMGRR